jgi:hypothetical protein
LPLLVDKRAMQARIHVGHPDIGVVRATDCRNLPTKRLHYPTLLQLGQMLTQHTRQRRGLHQLAVQAHMQVGEHVCGA